MEKFMFRHRATSEKFEISLSSQTTVSVCEDGAKKKKHFFFREGKTNCENVNAKTAEREKERKSKTNKGILEASFPRSTS